MNRLGHNQTGFGLLELLLVTVIAALFIIMGIRLYQTQRQQQQTNQAKQTAQLLLNAVNNYYYAYCAQSVTTINPSYIDGYYDQYGRAATMLNKPLTVTGLQSPDDLQNQFLDKTISTDFPFSTKKDGPDGGIYTVQLVQVPFVSNQCTSASSNQTNTPQNCFTQTTLWQARVSACVTSFTTAKKDPKDPKKKIYSLPGEAFIQSLFDPNEITTDADCNNGYVVTWESIPSIKQKLFSEQSDITTDGEQMAVNQMVRYGPWMQQGPLAGQLQQKLEYLCQ